MVWCERLILLGSVDKGYPEFCGDESDEAEERERGLVEARGDASPVFELVEQALDQVALPIGVAVVWDGIAAVVFRRDDGLDTTKQQFFADRVGVIALVGDQRLDLVFDEPEEGEERLPIVDFAAGEDEAERPAFAVAAGVDLGGEATARAAQSLRVLIPPFTPAAF
jgi:hypothetical protein